MTFKSGTQSSINLADSMSGAPKLPFVKMHGAGNDFVVIDARYSLPFDLSKFARVVCDRHFGIGADGLIGLQVSQLADFKMAYYNADGSASTCGNGIRCLARYVSDLKLPRSKNFQIETLPGVVDVELIGKGERVKVNMGAPVFEGQRIPVSAPGEHLGVPLEVAGRLFQIHAVGMGNPHAVIFVESLKELNLREIGPLIEHHPFFPERTNVEFVQVIDYHTLKMRVWERGVGETLACGTGGCAVLAASVRAGHVGRTAKIMMAGGEFEATYQEGTGHIYLTGPTEEVYRGEVNALKLLKRLD